MGTMETAKTLVGQRDDGVSVGAFLADPDYRLDDNLRREQGRVFLTGTQALLRMMVMQKRFDESQGLKTAGFISGYRGSPLGAVDQEVWRAGDLLKSNKIEFLPAINEDLGATAVLGTQQVGSDPTRQVDGVFALWYGKGPGVDRAGDAIKHGNAYGSSPYGGVLAVLGDDHGCVSSSMPHQSEQALMAWSMPILNPANIEEYLEFGLYGWALSRYSGTWVGFKAISETVEGGAVVTLPLQPKFATPSDYTPPRDGLHYRWPDLPGLGIEVRIHEKLNAVQAFARANPIDKLVVAAPIATLGIISAGKAYLDLVEALEHLEISFEKLEHLGIRIYKPGLTYPLETTRLLSFVQGLEEVLVVEEKGAIMEEQIKQLLYNQPQGKRPIILGKTDAAGAPLLSALGELRPSRIAPVLVRWLASLRPQADLISRLPALCASETILPSSVRRTPYFCSGCPHNTSTKVPDGSRALAGIGCHFMATWMDRDTVSLTQMGGEGVTWVAASRFVSAPHVFQNLGDGTYYHSGYLAIRQAIAANANITYKVLYNDAVAMTGGQPVDGGLSVPQIAQQVLSEGAVKVVVVTDDVSRYQNVVLPAGVPVHDRSELDAVQRELRVISGVSVLIYDQTCAAEKRRRRKKNRPGKEVFQDPQRRMVINPAVCEGCGDCGTQSNCLSILPFETELGRKRQIEQASCNKDYSCVEGFCPSFVSVVGGTLKKPAAAKVSFSQLEEALASHPPKSKHDFRRPFEVLVAGIGGTGVVTLGALVTMAAHLEGKGASQLDFMGFAQKGGAVMSHIRVAASPAKLNQARIDLQQADALLVCDLVVGAMPDALGVIRNQHTRVIANQRETPTAEFTRNPDAVVDGPALIEKLKQFAGDELVTVIEPTELAARGLGEPIAANIVLLGYAWQQGLIPVGVTAMLRAIELNNVAVELNKRAFLLGRLAAANPASLRNLIDPRSQVVQFVQPQSLEKLIEHRQNLLTAYQGAEYAQRYVSLVRNIECKELAVDGQGSKFALTRAVAQNLYKVMAYKDEYEVARLHSNGMLAQQIESQFEGDYELRFHLAPPLLSRRRGGAAPRKIAFGQWMQLGLKALAALKVLRGTIFDPFGYTEERRLERIWRDEYLKSVAEISRELTSANKEVAVRLARLPEGVRGYGHVKLPKLIASRDQLPALLKEFAESRNVIALRREA